jgi:PAS domain S-box-containing protein
MNRFLSCWNHKNIAGKLHLSLGSVFFLMALIISAWLLSLHLANQAKNTINNSVAIERTVLNMDRLLEKARRLHGDFLLQHNKMDLAEAHAQFAQPSVRLIAEAITTSSELKERIQRSDVGDNLRQHNVDLNLYLASAKRFADTSIESIELITRLATPETGLEAQFARLSASLSTELTENTSLLNLCRDLQVFYQRYQISRQRPVMQSAFNILFSLQQQIDVSPTLSVPLRNKLSDLIVQLKNTGEDILATDLALKNKFNDFNIQTNTVQPIARTLVNLAASEVEHAQARIILTLRISTIILTVFALAALGGGLLITWFIARSITQRIADLTDAASQIQQGRLNITAAEQPDDELGQLGRTFNSMGERIRELVGNLELKVEERTLQLTESEQRFRYIANEIPNVALIGFDRSRQVSFWNQTSERLYGPTSQEAVGRTIESLIATKTEQEVLQNNLRLWIEEDVAMPTGETIFRHRDGSIVQVYASFFMITNAQKQKEMYSIHIDLADLKKAQQETALRESLYRSLFEHTSSGVAVLEGLDEGRDFMVTDMNPAAERIEGRQRRNLVGRPLTESYPGVEPTGLLSLLRQAWNTGVPIYLPPTFYQYDNRQRWLQGHIYTIPSGEVVFVYDDVTKTQEAELERTALEAKLHRAQKMEAIGLLAGGVAHDLNNILSGIVSYPELILMQLDENSKLRKSVLAIQSSGQRAAAVVADLLTVARGVSSERRICHLNHLVEEYLASPEYQMLRSLHPGVECIVQLAADLWPLSCSPIHLKKSLMNLVTNGVEAIARTGRITIRTNNTDLDPATALTAGIASGKYVIMEVADSGSGIAATDIDHIFEPFYTKKVMGRSGTGLGLAVVWNTIQDHRGGITVTSGNQGTVFTLYFPASDDELMSQGEETDAAIYPGAGETILVVDDEPQLRDIARQMLDALGYEVVTAASGEQAVNYLKDHRVDLVLLDMLMAPGMNGRQTFEQIIALHPGQKALIASGFSKDEEVQRALRLGVSGYLQKPYVLNNLGKALDNIFHPLS